MKEEAWEKGHMEKELQGDASGPHGEENPEALTRRREQDLECLTLLREAMLLQRDREYVDSMFTALKGPVEEDPF